MPATTASTPKSNGFLPLESDDSEMEDFLDNMLERGRNMLKKGNPMSKTSSRYLLHVVYRNCKIILFNCTKY